MTTSLSGKEGSSEEMKRCPICHRAPSVDFKPVGSIELWVAGCDVHFKEIAAQPSYLNVISEWNAVVGQISMQAGQ